MKKRICVGGVLYRSGKILLGLRGAALSFYPGRWDITGGHCDPGELIEQTLVREFEEELDVTPIEWECLGIYAEPDPARHGPGEYHIYVVREWLRDPRNACPEHERVQWFAVDELEGLALAANEYIQIFAALR